MFYDSYFTFKKLLQFHTITQYAYLYSNYNKLKEGV